jgi:hypothetical protein
MLKYLLSNKKLLGFLAWIGLALPVVQMLQNSSPLLTYEILNNSNVLEIKEPLGKLVVLYDGKRLRDTHQSLRTITVRVQNTGGNSIKIGDYDERLPVGLSILHGEIIEIPKLSGSNEYLNSIVQKTALSNSSLSFPTAILAPKDYFQVSMMILASDDELPVVVPKGVIAGADQDSPKLIDGSSSPEKETFYEKAFSGNWKIQAARMPFYMLYLFAVMSLLTLVINVLRGNLFSKYDAIQKGKRIEIANVYLSDLHIQFNPILSFILSEYVERPDKFEINLGKRFSDLLELQDITRKQLVLTDLQSYITDDQIKTFPELALKDQRLNRVKELCGYAEEQDLVAFLKELDKQLTAFLEYLTNHGYQVHFTPQELLPGPYLNLKIVDLHKTTPKFNWYAEQIK